MADYSGGPGFLAFVVTFSLVVAGVLLFRSLSKHLRKVRMSDSQKASKAEPAPNGSAGVEGGDGGGDEVAGESGDR